MFKISVIIPCCNHAQYLRDTLDSVLKQTYQNFEIIVVDDGSTDDTTAIINDYLNKYPEIIKYFYQRNSGPSAARNKGLREARGEYIAFLDADDIWFSTKLEKQLNFLNIHNELGLAYSDFMEFGQSGIIKQSFFRDHKPVSGWIFENLIEENPIPTSTILAKRNVFKKVGFFDESLSSVEDYDMWLRIAQHYPISFINEVLVKKRKHDANISANTELQLICGIKVLEKVSTSLLSNNLSNSLKQRMKCQLWSHYRDLAWYYFSKGQMVNARKNFLLSFKYNISTKVVAYYLASFFPPKIMRALRQTKRYLINHAAQLESGAI